MSSKITLENNRVDVAADFYRAYISSLSASDLDSVDGALQSAYDSRSLLHAANCNVTLKGLSIDQSSHQSAIFMQNSIL